MASLPTTAWLLCRYTIASLPTTAWLLGYTIASLSATAWLLCSISILIFFGFTVLEEHLFCLESLFDSELPGDRRGLFSYFSISSCISISSVLHVDFTVPPPLSVSNNGFRYLRIFSSFSLLVFCSRGWVSWW